jgi:trehalose utilization protein
MARSPLGSRRTRASAFGPRPRTSPTTGSATACWTTPMCWCGGVTPFRRRWKIAGCKPSAIALHSSLNSKPFRALIGTSCRSAGYRHGGRELVWTASAAHPITDGVPNPVIVPDSEMYSEPFDIAQLDEVVFISSFDGGEVFRSGVTFRRGAGKIFYFAPGHEEYPIYFDPTIRRVINNAVAWAAPQPVPNHPPRGAARRDKPIGWFEDDGTPGIS